MRTMRYLVPFKDRTLYWRARKASTYLQQNKTMGKIKYALERTHNPNKIAMILVITMLPVVEAANY